MICRVAALIAAALLAGNTSLAAPAGKPEKGQAHKAAETGKAQAQAQEVGVLQVLRGHHLGSLVQHEIKLASANTKKPLDICDGGEAVRLLQLVGMEVEIAGAWQPLAGRGGQACLQVASFKVVKTSSGRNAIVGELVQAGNQYSVRQDDGKLHPLPLPQHAPARYQGMLGKRVIVDIKELAQGPLVVSCSLHP